MLYAAFLTLLIASVSAQEASISSALSSKCLEVRNFAKIKDGHAVQMLVEQDLMITTTGLQSLIYLFFSGITATTPLARSGIFSRDLQKLN